MRAAGSPSGTAEDARDQPRRGRDARPPQILIRISKAGPGSRNSLATKCAQPSASLDPTRNPARAPITAFRCTRAVVRRAILVNASAASAAAARRVAAVSLHNGLGAGAVETFLVAEIILQGRQADPGRLRDLARRHGPERGFAERLQRHVENPLPGLLALSIARFAAAPAFDALGRAGTVSAIFSCPSIAWRRVRGRPPSSRPIWHLRTILSSDRDHESLSFDRFLVSQEAERAMNTSIAELTGKVASQAAQIPSIYGRVDFSITPERFTVEPDAQTDLAPEFAARRPELLANEEQVARIKAYTMIGDRVADAYAALMPNYKFHRLVTMLTEACDHGVENVPAAPPELVRFIAQWSGSPHGWT